MARRETGNIVGLKFDKAKTDALEAVQGFEETDRRRDCLVVQHPRIVKTLYHGFTTNDEQFVVMEFLDGPG
jgi:hypothetical protein